MDAEKIDATALDDGAVAMFAHGRLLARPLTVALILHSHGMFNGPGQALAESPALEFDLGRTAECRDVTAELMEEAYSDQRLIECTLRFSVQLLAGDVNDVREIRVEVSDCDRSMRVHSFAPNTQLVSQHVGEIEWTSTSEDSHKFGLSLGGELPAPVGGVVAHVTPSVNSGLAQRDVITEKQRRVPPKEVLVASGTIEREHGVFFRLRPTPQTTLEGVHELTVRFLVSDDWRGDTLVVRSSASGQQKFLWLKQQKQWASEAHHVVLHLAGDEAARRAAERHAKRRI